MARGDASVKKRWSDWLNAQLRERGWNAADLVSASGDALVYGTVYNWTKGTARIEAETTLIVAAALGVSPSEALREASYPLFADAMEGKELHLVGAPVTAPPDPGIMEILAAKDLPDDVKVVMINWWRKRAAEDEVRRRADAEQMIELRSKRDSA